jgi:hypothetical protein
MYGLRLGAYAQIMTTPASEPGVPLEGISEAVAESMAATEATLSKELAATARLEHLDAADLLKIQFDMSSYTSPAQALAEKENAVSDVPANQDRRYGN